MAISAEEVRREKQSRKLKFGKLETAGTDNATFSVISVRAICNVVPREELFEHYKENTSLDS